MMKTTDPVKAYDSIEYGILLPDAVVKPERRRKRMSWCKCLCITVLVIIATLLVTTLMGATAGYFWMKHHVKRFTTTEPRSFPIHELPDAELEIIKDRAKLFYDTILAGQVPEQDFVVTEDELNALMAHSDFLRGNAYIHLAENNFSSDMSLPAKGLPGGKGRFFVGSGSVTVAPQEAQGQTKITTQLATPYEIKGLEHPQLLLGEFLAYIASDGTSTVNLLSGQFYNWVAPPDYIAKQENLLEHMCDDDDDNCGHHHDHHHDDDDHHHHHHNDDDDQDCKDVQTFLNGLAGVTIGDQQMTFSARPVENRRLASGKNNKASSSSYGSYARRSLMKMVF